MNSHTRLMVIFGGTVGTALRAAVGSASPGSFPWGTLTVNLIGTAALGLLVGRVEASPTMARWIPFAGVGVMGSLTTFATMMVEVLDLLRGGFIATAAAYTAVSLSMGAAVGLGGLRLGELRR